MPSRPAAGTPYAAAAAAGKHALRTLVLDTASRLLEDDGPDALTMRRIASEVGCSTTVRYTMFGGKPASPKGCGARVSAGWAPPSTRPRARTRSSGWPPCGAYRATRWPTGVLPELGQV